MMLSFESEPGVPGDTRWNCISRAGCRRVYWLTPSQIITFAVVSAALLLSLRPWLLRHLRHRVPLAETGAAAQIGRTAVVVDRVTELSGRIKLQGEIWSARTVDGSPELPIGAEVRVVRIDGATAVVQSLAPDSHTV